MFFSFSPLAAGIEGNGWLEFFICGCSYKIDFEASGNIWESEQLCLQRWYSGLDQELGWTLAYVPIAISSGPENSAAALLFKLCCYARPRPCPPCLATLSLNWQLLATWATANTRRGKDVTLRQAHPHTTRAAQTWRKYSLQRNSRTTWRSTCRARPCRPHEAARDELRRMNAEGGRQPQTEFLSNSGNMAASIFWGAQKLKNLNVIYRCFVVFALEEPSFFWCNMGQCPKSEGRKCWTPKVCIC